MKPIKFILASALLLSNMTFFSCSDTTDESVPVIFPEVVEKEFSPNSQAELTFNASADWRLTSSASWCSFVEQSETLQTIYGAAGAQTVTLSVSNVGTSFDKVDEATLTLTMASESKVIYKITRSSKEYEIILLDAEGNAITEENPVVLAYGQNVSFTVKGNFAWAVTEMPEWVTFNGAINGSSDVEVELVAGVTEGFTKSAKTGLFSIGSQADPSKYSFAVSYDGIPADKIEFSIPALQRERFEFSADGATYFYSVHPDAPKDVYEAPLPVTVTARNDEYTVVYLKYSQWGFDLMPSYEEWFAVADDNQGSLSISVSENQGKERFGAIVVLPKAIAEEMKGDYSSLLDITTDPDYWTIAPAYEDFVLLQVKQLAEVGGFIVTANGENMPVVKLENAEATYGTENVFVLTLQPNQSYDEIVIKPRGLSQWETVYPETYWNGVNTMWDGVEIGNSWDYTDYTALINIWGIAPNTTGTTRQMTLGVSGDNYLGYVLIEQ